MVGNLILVVWNLIYTIGKEVKMKKRTPTKKSSPKPTPRGLPTLKQLDELMKGVDLWEMDKPPEVAAQGRKERRTWLASKD